MGTDKTTPKGRVEVYPPGGGDPVEYREDQVERYLHNGWTENKERARKAASEGAIS